MYFISGKSCDAVKNPDFIPSLIFSKAIQIGVLVGWFLPQGFMFDNPALKSAKFDLNHAPIQGCEQD